MPNPVFSGERRRHAGATGASAAASRATPAVGCQHPVGDRAVREGERCTDAGVRVGARQAERPEPVTPAPPPLRRDLLEPEWRAGQLDDSVHHAELYEPVVDGRRLLGGVPLEVECQRAGDPVQRVPAPRPGPPAPRRTSRWPPSTAASAPRTRARPRGHGPSPATGRSVAGRPTPSRAAVAARRGPMPPSTNPAHRSGAGTR